VGFLEGWICESVCGLLGGGGGVIVVLVVVRFGIGRDCGGFLRREGGEAFFVKR